MDEYGRLNGSNLAYIGDAYYELCIRKFLIDSHITKSGDLRRESIRYVSAHAHQMIVDVISETLTAEEVAIYNRGRNSASTSYRKNVVMSEYQTSSGFEAVIGYHYLLNHTKRLEQLISAAINAIRSGETNEDSNLR
jgi:ribonuclease-3 family protein